MATFLARVLLDNGTIGDYTKLKNLLAKGGFTKFVKSKEGLQYRLPNGNYLLIASKDKNDVRDFVVAAANQVKGDSMVLIAEVVTKGMAWSNLPPA